MASASTVNPDVAYGVVSVSELKMFSNVESRFLPPPENLPTLTFGMPDLQYVWYKSSFNAAREILDANVSKVDGAKIAIVELANDGTENKISYSELRSRVNKCSNGLKTLGISPGDRVLLRFQDTIWAAIAQLACWKIGAIVVPSAIGESSREISFLLQDTEAVAAICDSRFAEPLIAAGKECPELKWSIGDEEPIFAGAASLRQFVETESDHCETYASNPFDASGIYYTGGTTGKPKGCLHTHASEVILADLNMAARGAVMGGSVLFTHAPIGHAFGNGEKINFPLRWGATVIYAVKPSPKAMWEIIERYGVTHLAGVVTMYRMMLKESPTPLEQYPGIMLESVVSSGEILDQPTFDMWTKAGLPLRNTVGMTPMRHLFIESASNGIKVGPGVCVGKPLPGYEAKMLDEKGNLLGAGEPGRLAIRGPSGITYWINKHPGIRARAAADVRGGWSLLDDSYTRDENGWLWFNGRLDDMIVTGGRQIAPVEIETVLATHPDVLEVCVYAASDELRGYVVAAAVVLREGAKQPKDPESAFNDYLRDKLASYKFPRHYEFLEELPKDGVGKIQRRILRENLEAKRKSENVPDFQSSTP